MKNQNPWHVRAIVCALAAVAIVSICAQWQTARAQSTPATPTVMVILDGSGSMWGKLGEGQQTKLGLSQKLLAEALSAPNPKLNLGFASFGHRRAGNCSDSQVVVPPGPANAALVREKIAKLNPRGKGPLSRALRETAASIDPGSASTIILIHDGYDNCRQDPCKAADDIATSHPNLAIQLISLDLPKSASAAMSCLAKKTRGKAYVVSSEAEFKTAMQSAMAVTMLRPPKVAERLTDKQSPDALKLQAAKTGPSRLRLVAGLKSYTDQRITDVTWRILSPVDLKNTLIEKRTEELAEPLPPGRYIVRATAGLAQTEQQITVAEQGETQTRVMLDAGLVSFTNSAPESITGDTGDPMFLALRDKAGDDVQEDVRPLWIGTAKKTNQLIVPTGRYALLVERGSISKTVDVRVASGKETKVDTALEGGLLILDSTTTRGQPDPSTPTQTPVPQRAHVVINTVAYTITTDDPSAPGGRREVSRSAFPRATFQLPPGTFYAQAQLGEAKRERRFAIGGGQVVRHQFQFDVAEVTIEARLGNRSLPKNTPVSFKAYPLNAGTRSPAIVFNKRNPSVILPKGRYRFEAEVAGKVRGKSADVDVLSNATQTIAISLNAGQVSLQTKSPTARRFASAKRYQIRDSSGVIVWRGRANRPVSTVLDPGAYSIENRSDPAQKQSFEVRVGEVTGVDLDEIR